ncbi:MAG TPA: peroxiredoxin [Methanomassiliicoccaceae archaeon]|nr:peroxiredoxin [Methanomassiliicoccaceae archaeon]
MATETVVRTGMPLLGDPFTEMEVMTTHGPMKLPGDKKGKWWVLFSHPGDFTPVCTTEFYAFTKRWDQFQEMGVDLVGHSVDQVFSHLKWVEWINEKLNVEVPFPVIADGMGDVAVRLGMIHPGKGSNSVRSVYVIDPQGILRLMIYYPQEIGRSVDEIIRAVKALQTSDANKVSMPEGWPRNDLFQDKVILPPPKNEKDAKERKKALGDGCLDWWLCTKQL